MQPHASGGLVSLKRICLENISKNITEDSYRDDIPTVHTPLDISQEIFDVCIREAGVEEVNNILNFFLKNPTHTPLRQICLRNSWRADVNLIHNLVKANLGTLMHLDVRGCRVLPSKFWSLLHNAPSLLTLKTTSLLMPLQCQKVEVLVVDWKPKTIIQKLQRRVQHMYYDKLLQNVMGNLTYLDLSWCSWAKRLRTLGNAKSLETLILKNCDISGLVNDICQLSGLRILDISSGQEQESSHYFNGIYSNPDCILKQIVTYLPKLESLDISGTNLIPTSENSLSFLSSFDTRRNTPFEFLGMYTETCNGFSQRESLPALCVTGSDNPQVLIEAIKRNVGMPKTLRNQLGRLRSMSGSSLDVNMLLGIQINMLKNLRANEHFRFSGLKCLNNFLDHMESPVGQIRRETKKELFLILNQLNHYHSDCEKVSELSLRFTFQIFSKLLSDREVHDDGISREVMRLGKFLMSLNRTNFVYFKTETILFRLLHRLSGEPDVCTYLSENNVVLSCFEFFKTIQVYLGNSLRVSQTSEIVTITWKSILSFMQASQTAIQDFIKYKGLSWMYAHLSWFSFDERTKEELQITFIGILNFLGTHLSEVKEERQKRKEVVRSISLPKDLVRKVKFMIDN